MATVIEEIRLINVSATDNMNRWWTGRLFDNDDFESTWGRVGVANPGRKLFPGGGKKKLEEMRRDKEKKGYTYLKTEGGPASVTAAKVQDVGRHELREIAKAQLLKTSNPLLDKLIDRFVQANVHKITSSTQITFNSSTGLFSTPLGIVTPAGITEARDLLAAINNHVANADWTSTAMTALTNSYLRIVPTIVGRRLEIRTLFADNNAIQKHSDVLDSLESSYQALQSQPATSGPAKKQQQVFKVDLDVLNDSKEWSRVNDWYEKSKRDMHNYGSVKIRQIYTVNIHEMTNAYEEKTAPHQEVWHGTSQANVLSILKSGLKTAPPSTAAIAGKMFGNGIYGAIHSSKSLGYTFNRWGQGGVGDAGWLFVCYFAMGKTETVYSSCNPSHGYDSIWAKAGRGLYNDELIVYRNSQVKVRYLLECK